MRTRLFLTITLLGLAFMMVACGILATPTPDSGDMTEYLSQTMSAVQTLSAGETAVAQLTQIAQPTQVINTPGQGTPVEPTWTPLPVGNTPTAVPTPTINPLPCNAAMYISDVTYADYSDIIPGVEFRKVWRVKNVGSCTWTANYSFIWVDGFKMKGSDPQPIGVYVEPGQMADIGVDLTSPTTNPGQYKSFYFLQDESGNKFGVGADGKTPFWIIANVGGDMKIVYDMAPEAKKATWKNSVAVIEYGKTGAPESGYATDSSTPKMESGSTDDEAALLVRPDAKNDGKIQGVFPQITIKNGDHFNAVISCQYGYPKCNIKFTLSYRVDGSDPIVLAEWNEITDNKYNKVDVDLSKLAGKTVQLVLTVTANGESTDDYGIWLRPRVMGYR